MIMRLWDYLRIDYGGSDRSGMRYGCLGVAGDTRGQHRGPWWPRWVALDGRGLASRGGGAWVAGDPAVWILQINGTK